MQNSSALSLLQFIDNILVLTHSRRIYQKINSSIFIYNSFQRIPYTLKIRKNIIRTSTLILKKIKAYFITTSIASTITTKPKITMVNSGLMNAIINAKKYPPKRSNLALLSRTSSLGASGLTLVMAISNI